MVSLLLFPLHAFALSFSEACPTWQRIFNVNYIVSSLSSLLTSPLSRFPTISPSHLKPSCKFHHHLQGLAVSMSSTIQFSPAMPMPIYFDVQERITTLKSFLDPNHRLYERAGQHENIRHLIKLYEDGIIDGTHTTYVSQGRVISKDEYLNATTWCIKEVS